MEKPKFRAFHIRDGVMALIDEEDFDLVEKHKWHLVDGYACRSGSGLSRAKIRMHREIVGAFPCQEVDHINGDRLDNRRSNLRVCTHAQNLQNRRRWSTDGLIPFKGVRQTKSNTWIAQARVAGKMTYLGTFRSPEDAARAFDRIAFAQYGEFARLNFPTREIA